jgi:Na+/melibiose symporter-like transporter
MFGWFFLGALYLQRVLGYGALETGCAFLPMTAIVAVFSLFITTRVVARLGPKATLLCGLACSACGDLLYARVPVGGHYLTDLLPAIVLTGTGAGLTFMPTVSLAMAGAGQRDAGLVSGLTNVSVQVGAALGVAALASISTTHTNDLLAHGRAIKAALTSGYDLGFAVAAGSVMLAMVVAGALIRMEPAREAAAADRPARRAA